MRAAAFDVEVFDELFDLNPFDLEHGEASRVDRLERQLILKPFIRGRIEGTCRHEGALTIQVRPVALKAKRARGRRRGPRAFLCFAAGKALRLRASALQLAARKANPFVSRGLAGIRRHDPQSTRRV